MHELFYFDIFHLRCYITFVMLHHFPKPNLKTSNTNNCFETIGLDSSVSLSSL